MKTVLRVGVEMLMVLTPMVVITTLKVVVVFVVHGGGGGIYGDGEGGVTSILPGSKTKTKS